MGQDIDHYDICSDYRMLNGADVEFTEQLNQYIDIWNSIPEESTRYYLYALSGEIVLDKDELIDYCLEKTSNYHHMVDGPITKDHIPSIKGLLRYRIPKDPSVFDLIPFRRPHEIETYPLWIEIADRATDVYYIGISNAPLRRLQYHLRGNSSQFIKCYSINRVIGVYPVDGENETARKLEGKVANEMSEFNFDGSGVLKSVGEYWYSG